jgi:hypothetical protein
VLKESRLLRTKALSSMRRAMQSFNSLDDDGRSTSVLLLLKAALRERKVAVFDKKTGRSLGFDKCLRLANEHLALSSESTGVLRAIDAMRDDQQHYLGGNDEALLYLHFRAAITVFDDILHEVFSERLGDHIPARVLPVSTLAPQDIDVLIDSHFTQVQDLLQPGRRMRDEARQQIRTLLALEGHVSEDVAISEKDVNRVERAVKAGKTREEVFPRLADLTTAVGGAGIDITVRISKKEGAPVRYIGADDPTAAAAVREVDLQRKYHLSRSDLSRLCGISPTAAKRLREKLGIDERPDCCHVFEHGQSRFPSFSDKALKAMRESLAPATEGGGE